MPIAFSRHPTTCINSTIQRNPKSIKLVIPTGWGIAIQRNEVTCPRKQRKSAAESELEPRAPKSD